MDPFDSDDQMEQADQSNQTGQAGQRSVGCASFDSGQFEREVTLDNGSRWLLISGLIVLCLPTAASVLLGATIQEPEWFSSLMVFIIVAWIWVSTTSTRIVRQLGSIAVVMDRDPFEAEGLLAQTMTKRPLQRAVRLMLYHRLALLRHRQMRFYESATICHFILSQPTAIVPKLRTSLLLVQTESLLHIGDVSGAFGAISQLQASPLRLGDRLQLLPLQIRYELLADQNRIAITHVKERVRLAELMPSFQCGAVHGMLAVAAERTDQPALAKWLHARADLFTNFNSDDEEI
jgi:hypothetical protein